MQIDIYQLTVPQLIHSLGNLKNILTKSNSHFADRKTDFMVVAQTRLVPDMMSLGKQIQIVTDHAKGIAARLTGATAPVFQDKEQTYEEFITRIDKTIAFLKTIQPDHFKSWATQVARFPYFPGKHLEATPYLIGYAIPNFYFHLTTAYAILRANGVNIGKADFLGEQPWKND